jgi:hypothetical protein
MTVYKFTIFFSHDMSPSHIGTAGKQPVRVLSGRQSGARQGPEPPSHEPRRTNTLLQHTFNPSTNSAALTLTNQEAVGGQAGTSRGQLTNVWFYTPENPDENNFS